MSVIQLGRSIIWSCQLWLAEGPLSNANFRLSVVLFVWLLGDSPGSSW